MSVLLILFAVLFTGTAALEDCTSYNDSRGDLVLCSLGTPQFTRQFCCGTCDEIYCCDDPQQKLTKDAQNDCLFKTLKFSSDSTHQMVDHTDFYVVPIVMFLIAIILFMFCYCLGERLHPHVMSTTTVMTQYHPQGSQYSAYQSVPNNPQPAYGGQPMPVGPSQGPPPTYQEAAGPGYPVPFIQAAYSGQDIQPAHPPLPADYTSPQPAYNPAYVELP
ncbi:protein shisa-5-like [Megalobrama amblycephala]|uniref:protein shisa-5-like n=1 Tax=Megalobrama amblycephala TaxID=75352 RepID=UPI00201401B1|nr:protein shisa-5-like [Megalobrama amblycephala]